MGGRESALSDQQIIQRQLGRRRSQPAKVLLRCAAGYPVVIAPRPPREPASGPFVYSTLYWLTCPRLSERAGREESAGWVAREEKRIAGNGRLRARMRAAHRRYARLRVRALGRDGIRRLSAEHPGMARAAVESGIGGTIDTARLKCLHAHAAYHLAAGRHPLFAGRPSWSVDLAGCTRCDSLESKSSS